MVLGCAWLISRQVDDLGAAVRRLSAVRVAVAGVAAVAGTVCIERLWFALLTGLGVRVAHRDAAEVFYVTQLGKYVPGSVWPVLAQVQLGARWGVPRRLMLGANVLLLVVVTVTGLIVGALLLPWASPDGLERYWWLLLLLPPLALLLHPRAVTTLIDRLLGLLGREHLGVHLTSGSVLRAAAWAMAAWGCLGVHLVVLATAYEPVSVALVAGCVGGMGLAWAAGLAFVPAPAGAGVRETVLVLTLAPLTGSAAAALSVALSSRVLLLLADVVLAGAASLDRRFRSAPAEQ